MQVASGAVAVRSDFEIVGFPRSHRDDGVLVIAGPRHRHQASAIALQGRDHGIVVAQDSVGLCRQRVQSLRNAAGLACYSPLRAPLSHIVPVQEPALREPCLTQFSDLRVQGTVGEDKFSEQ